MSILRTQRVGECLSTRDLEEGQLSACESASSAALRDRWGARIRQAAWEVWAGLIKTPVMSLPARLSPLCCSQGGSALPSASRLRGAAAATRERPQSRRVSTTPPAQSGPRVSRVFPGKRKRRFGRGQPRGLTQPQRSGGKGCCGLPSSGSGAGGDVTGKAELPGGQRCCLQGGESPRWPGLSPGGSLRQAERLRQPRAGVWEALAACGSGLQRVFLFPVCLRHQKPRSPQQS